MSVTDLRVTVVAADLTADAGMWGDASGGWQPAAERWVGLLAALGVPYTVRSELAQPVTGLVIDPYGGLDWDPACPVLTGDAPANGEATLEVLADALGAVVVPDLRGVLVLRLDDPGAAVKEHLQGWAHAPVPEATWEALWTELDGFGRASMFCCPGYVRADGLVLDSREALPQEWAALDEGVARGVADLECHGYTHMHPDTAAWAAAPDRDDDVRWFRELWPPGEEEPPIDAQADRLRRWQQAVGRPGTTVVAPGEEWGLQTLAAAKECGFTLFNSWGLCFLDRFVPTWSVGIGSPYLDRADSSWFDDCLPQIGYWHDRDMAVNGPDWVTEQLSAWRDCGARRALSFADLAAAYAPIDAALVDGELVVRASPDVPLRVVLG